jgi:Nuclease A inhibitor-like protein
MSKEKKIRVVTGGANLSGQIEKIARGLYYISETDAEISPFRGTKAVGVTKEILLSQTGNAPDAPVEERNFEDFFKRLTKIEDWFGDEENKSAAKFRKLKELLERNLKDLKVFKVGRIEIDIYVVGLDKEGNLAGIKTKAVET